MYHLAGAMWDKKNFDTQKIQIHTRIYREIKTTATTTYHLAGAMWSKKYFWYTKRHKYTPAYTGKWKQLPPPRNTWMGQLLRIITKNTIIHKIQNTKRKQSNKHSELNCHHDVPPGWSENYLWNTHTSKHSITQSTSDKYKHIKRTAGVRWWKKNTNRIFGSIQNHNKQNANLSKCNISIWPARSKMKQELWGQNLAAISPTSWLYVHNTHPPCYQITPVRKCCHAIVNWWAAHLL